MHNNNVFPFLFINNSFLERKIERMEAWVDSLKDAVSLVADNKAILGGAGGLALLSIAGAVPRVGFVRAFTVGWRSYFKNTYPLSVRGDEIKRLSNCIKSLAKGSYITVIGGKGNGKSCFIDTTLNRHHGVVKISVSYHSVPFIRIVIWRLLFLRLNLVLIRTSSLTRSFEKSLAFESTSSSQLQVLVVSSSSIPISLSVLQLWL